MATNKTARDTMVIVAIVVAVCVTIFANLLADKKFGRLDLTKEGRYSLSQPFKNILGRLEDVICVIQQTQNSDVTDPAQGVSNP